MHNVIELLKCSFCVCVCDGNGVFVVNLAGIATVKMNFSRPMPSVSNMTRFSATRNSATDVITTR
jgi:hypothetical protein